jgi:hypothetical protein
MQIYFAGAEISSHLAVLRECGVERVAVSISNLARTGTNDLATWATHKRLDGLEWVLYADGPAVPSGPVLELLQSAEVQPEIVTGPIAWYENTWLSNTDLLFLPTWDAQDPTILRDFTENYDGVTLPDAVVDNPTAVRQARASINRLGQLAAITGRTKGLERFDTLVSSAWWAVQKYGETQVWAGNRMVRMNAEDKRLKRERYASAVEELGCDPGKVIDDDPTETVKVSVLSWLALERHLALGRSQHPVLVTNPDPLGLPANVVPLTPGVAKAPPRTRHHMLPVMASMSTTVKQLDEHGKEIDVQQNTITVTPISLRQCNTCALAIACPSHSPGSSCSYEIPVEIQSKNQLTSVLRAVTEIQTQRVLMGRFAEEIQGEPNPDLGKEMDRLFSMVEKWRAIEDNRDTVRMTLEARGHEAASMGVLSRLFGSQVGQNAARLDTTIDSNDVIEEMREDD